jgi:hypothetical protein
MENKHTPEPWAFCEIHADVFAPEGHVIASTYKRQIQTNEIKVANAARIVACVNFCANIPNEQLEGTTLEAILKDYAMMRSYIETMGGAS